MKHYSALMINRKIFDYRITISYNNIPTQIFKTKIMSICSHFEKTIINQNEKLKYFKNYKKIYKPNDY